MRPDKIQEAISEARRFIARAEKALKDYETNKYAWNGTPATGAAKRASMDLTRALADMRKAP